MARQNKVTNKQADRQTDKVTSSLLELLVAAKSVGQSKIRKTIIMSKVTPFEKSLALTETCGLMGGNNNSTSPPFWNTSDRISETIWIFLVFGAY